MSGIVYIAHSKVDDHIYVGQTVMTLARRRYGHDYSARIGAKSRMGDAIRKHGISSFEFSVLQECDSKEELNATEKLWIILLGSTNPNIGHNVFLGTHSKRISKRPSPSEETKSKVSASMKGTPRPFSPQHRDSVIAANKTRIGVKLTDQHKAKCSASLKGVKKGPQSADHREKIAATKRGKSQTIEANAKRSKTQKGRPHSEEHRLKLALANKARAIRERAERA